jgi:hypothetical protein
VGTGARYPSVQEYASGLPAAWASFPECRVRAELLTALRTRGALSTLSGLDETLQAIVDEPSMPGVWLPEVTHVGVLLAVRDATFPEGDAGDTQFLAWMDQLNRVLFASPEHEAAFTDIATMLRTLPAFWSRLREGSSMEVTRIDETRAELVQVHPRRLYTDLIRRSHRMALVAALARAGAVGIEVDVFTDRGNGVARTTFDMHWRSA